MRYTERSRVTGEALELVEYTKALLTSYIDELEERSANRGSRLSSLYRMEADEARMVLGRLDDVEKMLKSGRLDEALDELYRLGFRNYVWMLRRKLVKG